MTDNVQVNGPIEIKDNSTERVAYDLMSKIANNEAGLNPNTYNEDIKKQQRSREYWLTLYAESYRVVAGRSYPPKV